MKPHIPPQHTHKPHLTLHAFSLIPNPQIHHHSIRSSFFLLLTQGCRSVPHTRYLSHRHDQYKRCASTQHFVSILVPSAEAEVAWGSEGRPGVRSNTCQSLGTVLEQQRTAPCCSLSVSLCSSLLLLFLVFACLEAITRAQDSGIDAQKRSK
ncbi:hypothetical protein E2C01_077209 [Portunus trituberculatus]|uniref:Uncharacterized protein n=1 Tax=Portunus trituberculatus TaxID=210409 RepID=A0A5B7ILK2_PORTR|nr:hypothetical protein [Portunus trituberculatus]